MHPRNRHPGRYDFAALTEASPELQSFVARTPYGDWSIDFSDPEAVKALNRALIQKFYGIRFWDFPNGYLCPPIPGRSDYVHHIADLLADCNDEVIPRGPGVRVLDVGVGASAIYPIVGWGEYGWSFVGTDIDPIALDSARSILQANPELGSHVELRQQADPHAVFAGVVSSSEKFDLVICNPPFHASAIEAEAGTRRKWENLGRESGVHLNFGGQSSELWCLGGEVGFIRRMMTESVSVAGNVFCFSTLVSKDDHLEPLYEALDRMGAETCAVIEMHQGQKKSRLLAWTFLSVPEQQSWVESRWKPNSAAL